MVRDVSRVSYRRGTERCAAFWASCGSNSMVVEKKRSSSVRLTGEISVIIGFGARNVVMITAVPRSSDCGGQPPRRRSG